MKRHQLRISNNILVSRALRYTSYALILIPIWGSGQSFPADVKYETKVGDEKAFGHGEKTESKDLTILKEKVQSLEKRIDADLEVVEKIASKTIESSKIAIEADKHYTDYITTAVYLLVVILGIIGSVLGFFGFKEIKKLRASYNKIEELKQKANDIVGSLQAVHDEAERNKINVMAVVAITRVTTRLWLSDAAKDKTEKERRAQEALVELEEAERLGHIKSASLLLEKGKAYKRLGRYHEALQMAMAATIEAKEAKNAFDEARSYYNGACYWTLLERTEPALKLLKQSIDISSAFRIMAEKDEDLEYLRKNDSAGFRALVPHYKTNEPATQV